MALAQNLRATLLDSKWRKNKEESNIIAVSVLLLLCAGVGAAVALIVVEELPSKVNSLLWWQRAIIYQCYPRSFQDSGTGDLNGIRSRLDYFVDIGIGAVWLNPIYLSPLIDNGYDISNYTDNERLQGSPGRHARERDFRLHSKPQL